MQRTSAHAHLESLRPALCQPSAARARRRLEAASEADDRLGFGYLGSRILLNAASALGPPAARLGAVAAVVPKSVIRRVVPSVLLRGYEDFNRRSSIPHGNFVEDFEVYQAAEVLGTVETFHGRTVPDQVIAEPHEAFYEVRSVPRAAMGRRRPRDRVGAVHGPRSGKRCRPETRPHSRS